MANKILGILKYYRTLLIIFIPAILLLPLPIVVDGTNVGGIQGKEPLAGYMLILMAIYWCTEVLPLGITSLMPLFFVPVFGITPAKKVCDSYMNDTTMLLVGGLIMAIGVENCNLHRRIAIRVLMTIGGSPRWLMLGFMLPTWLLSMWISNTATTAMMMPIVEEVLNRLQALYEERELGIVEGKKEEVQQFPSNNSEADITTVFYVHSTDNLMQSMEAPGKAPPLKPSSSYTSEMQEDIPTLVQPAPPKSTNTKIIYLGKALTISVAYAANAGGTGTLIGTAVNPILKGQADELWASKGCGESPINFVSWMVMGLPVSAMNLFIIWIWLEVFFVGIREFCGRATEIQKQEEKIVKQFLRKEYKKLGPMSVAEIQVFVIFILLVLLWFFREPGFMHGWNYLLKGYTSDATPAIFIAVLLFIIPDHYEKFPDKKAEPLVTWRAIKQKFPWDVVLLLGGGMALAAAVEDSKLSDWIGDKLTVLEPLPGPLLIIILGLLVALITEFTSNVASASLLVPIAAAMAEKLGKNPLYLMFPVTIGVQYAFMLPVATPPNAVAFMTGRITVLDMVKAGSILNVLCVLVMTLATTTWGMDYFNLDTIPWDTCANMTTNSF